MKVTLFISSLEGGGAERVVVNLAGHLCREGHEVTILNFEPKPCAYVLDPGIEVKYLLGHDHKSNIFSWAVYHFFHERWMTALTRRYVKSSDADMYIAFLEEPSISLLSNRKYIKCPVIVSERNWPGIYSSEMQARLRSLFPKADCCVFQTEAARAWYGDGLKSTCVIPNAVNPQFLGYDAYEGERTKRIVSVGRIEKQKNHRLLIDSFRALNRPDYVLEIYGTGLLENETKAYVRSIGLENKVIFKGFVKDIPSAIRDASLFVMSSDYEGIPNSLIEAMAIGVPCVTTDFEGGAARLLLEDRSSGRIVPSRDARDLASAMEEVLDNPKMAAAMALRARERIMQFSPERIYGMWTDALEKTLREAGRNK